MRLEQLKAACDEYSRVGKSFDDATREFRGKKEPTVGPALMTWLNKWGCRQFATAQHALALSELVRWGESHQSLLPHEDALLTSLSDDALDSLASAYDKLRLQVAAEKRRADSLISVHFGPTGAAKILYALRPNCCPPWDVPIRKHFHWDGGEASYCCFLKTVRAEILDLIKETDRAGIEARDIPRRVGRPDSSLPKLIDEYYWITITKR